MDKIPHVMFLASLIFINCVAISTASGTRGLLARTETGWVAGTRRTAQNGQEYASFLGIPYAKQPLGELRFQELQPAEPWDCILDASTEGPVCPHPEQARTFYGPMMQPKGMSEACIFANVHVPIHALPNPNSRDTTSGGLPIVVHIHGGNWITGSGDRDIQGAEYLMGKGVIVVTFNYRLGVPGFLSLNNRKIPGNNGLRDALTVLRWVQTNAHYFGGNPEEVTLSGQGAGATAAHLLSLSPAAKGLFKRVWLLSGAAIQSVYTASPTYAKEVADMLLSYLGITTTNEDEIYYQLINTPIEKITEASGRVIIKTGITSFVPVVETQRPGITTIIPEDPESLIAQGKGNDIPIVIGFTSNECETLRPSLEAINALEMFEQNPSAVVFRGLAYSLPSQKTAEIAERIRQRYFSATPTMDEYVRMCSDSLFVYPALRLARARVLSGGKPVHFYKYAYSAEHSPISLALNLTSYCGAGHTEDLNHIFKVNSVPVPSSSADDAMSELMSNLFVNFIKNGDPSHRDVSWPPYPYNQYFYIVSDQEKQYVEISQYDQEIVEFYDSVIESENTDPCPETRVSPRTYQDFGNTNPRPQPRVFPRTYQEFENTNQRPEPRVSPRKYQNTYLSVY